MTKMLKLHWQAFAPDFQLVSSGEFAEDKLGCLNDKAPVLGSDEFPYLNN